MDRTNGAAWDDVILREADGRYLMEYLLDVPLPRDPGLAFNDRIVEFRRN
jgi:hypothetical protein